MKKLLLVVFASIVLAGYGMAQTQKKDPYSFMLNGKAIKPEPNVSKVTKAFKTNPESFTTSSGKHFIIQFQSIPKLEEQAKLKKEGITLLSYISGNAYFAAIEPSFFKANAASSNLRSILVIQPEYKISEQLVSGKIPDYAKDKSGKVKVVISYFDKTDEEQIQSDLNKLKISNASIFAKFHQVQASVSTADLLKLATLTWIQNIELISPPSKLENQDDRTSHKVNVLNSSIRGLGYGLSGKNIKIGLWDGDVDKHRDFNGRVITREFEMHTTDHGTHTCGTIAGAGLLDPLALGMAPDATVYAWNFNTQSNGLNNAQERMYSLENDGIEITSNSFGSTLSVCPNTYDYDYSDRNEDYLASVFPYFLYVYSAGNSQDVCPDGFRTTTKNIKNSLVVANIDNQDKINWSSSFGPSADGRLIPNISGVGTDVYSTFLNNTYGYMTGTSMATPGVAGTMALVYQRYKETHGGAKPISSLMRALACNTANDLGNAGPDYKYGYGIINGKRAVDVMEQKHYFTDSVSQASSITKSITIPEGAVGLRVMLSWTDIEGTPGASFALVNDLDLKVSKGGTTVLPWVLDPANPSALATQGIDHLNNLEQVTIPNPTAGTYTIVIKGTTIPAGKQEFAVVYDVVMPELKLTYPIGGENLVPNTEAVISWDFEGTATPFTLEYSADNGATYTSIAANIPSNVRHYLWTVPADVNVANAKIRVSTASSFDETKESFSVMPVPKNVKVANAECGVSSYAISWDAVNNANYKVYKLKGQVYEFLADVTTNSYTLTGLTPSIDNYFCIRAVDKTNGAISERSLAVTVNPIVNTATVPFKENFDKQKADNFYYNNKNGLASIQFINDSQTYGIRLEGPSSALTTPWDASAKNRDECFTKNPDYIVKAGICKIDASSLAGKKMILTFDYRQKYRTARSSSYFRVSVNGNYVTNVEGVKVYDGVGAQSYQTVSYDLSAYAGNSSVTVEFEAVCETGYITYLDKNGNYDYSDDALDKGDFVAIDNIVISEPSMDVALIAIDTPTGVTKTETVTVAVKNNTLSPISNIPVSYLLNGKGLVSEVIPGPIAPSSSIAYNFTKKIDLSTEGIYIVKAYTSLLNDSVNYNDTLSIKFYNDPSIKIGETTGTVSVDNAVFTDHGGKFDNYPNKETTEITFKPATAGKTTKVTFSEFGTEPDFDYLYVFNGPDTDSPLLGKFTGTTIPPSFVSTADGGELTFKFEADPYVNDIGWLASIESVDKNAVDATIVSVLSPAPLEGVKTNAEEIQVEVGNKGTETLNAFDLYYQINELTPVKESFTGEILSGESAAVSFATKADLSVAGTYLLKIWVVAVNDTTTSNDTQTVQVVNLGSVIDAAITYIVPITPRRNATTSIKGYVENLGTEPISNVDVAYKINSGTEVKQTIIGPIEPGGYAPFIFSNVDLTNPDTYQIEVFSSVSGDVNPDNNGLINKVTTVTPSATNVFGYFDGTSTLVTAPAIPAMNLTNNYTVECWANIEDAPTFGRLFDKTNVTLFYQTHYSSVYDDNSMILNVTTIGGTFTYYYPGVVADLLNSWHHYALTVSADNEYKLYIDGVEQTPVLYGSGTVDATKANSTKPFYIGNRADLARGAAGAIDEVRVWDSCLSQATIAANTTTDYAANTAGLLAYYKFKEGAGSYLFDYSINDNTAILSGNNVSKGNAGSFWYEPDYLFKDFNVTGEKIPTTFDAQTNTFTTVMDNADLSAVEANFTSVQNSIVKINGDVQTSGTVKDFSAGTVTYTVDGVGFNAGLPSQTYTVNISNDLKSDCELTAFSFESDDNGGKPQTQLVRTGDKFYKKLAAFDATALKASFIVSPGAKVYINNVLQTSPQATAFNFSKPVLVKVEAENGRSFKNYVIEIDTRSNLAELLTFSIASNQIGTTTINASNHSIMVNVKKNTDLTTLVPVFSVSPNAQVFVNNVSQLTGLTCNDITNPITYEVVSEDTTTTIPWKVTVVKDVTAPVISLLGNATVTIGLGSTYIDAGATATDNIDGIVTSTIVKTGSVDYNKIGSYIITYNVTDEAGNAAIAVKRTVNVVDQTKPTISLTGNSQVTIAFGSTYTDAGATAKDNVDGDITSKIVTTSTVNEKAIGTYTITYKVSDAAGNKADTVVRTVSVTDQTKPTISLTGNSAITIGVGSTYTDAGAKASDNVDGDITSKIVTTGTVNEKAVGTYTITYKVSDAAGNKADTVVRTVSVTDQTKPTISLTGYSAITIGVGSAYTDAGAKASDNVDGDITSKIVTTSTVNEKAVGTYTITYKVSDAAGNKADTVIRTVRVVKIQATSVTVTGANNATAITTIAGTLQLTASVMPENTTDKTVTWSITEGSDKATISATGLVTALKSGTVTVKAIAADGSAIEGTLVLTISNQETGINEYVNNLNISVYPNPASDFVYVKKDFSATISIEIVDMAGRIVAKQISSEPVSKVAISQLNRGFYLVIIKNDQTKEVKTVKISVN